jgi:hypothetical protein
MVAHAGRISLAAHVIAHAEYAGRKIQITGVPGSGCYGHNGADDAAADAAVLALEYPGKHVRLQWSREEEHGWEPYGSAMIMELAAQLGPGGKISAWKYNLWSDTHSTRPAGAPQNLLAYQYMQQTPQQPERGFTAGAYRNAEPYYDIDNVTIQASLFQWARQGVGLARTGRLCQHIRHRIIHG